MKGTQRPPGLHLSGWVMSGAFAACPLRPEIGGCGSSCLDPSRPFTRGPDLCKRFSDHQEGSHCCDQRRQRLAVTNLFPTQQGPQKALWNPLEAAKSAAF